MGAILLFGCVYEHVCDFLMYCTVIFFLSFFFCFFLLSVTFGGLCLRPKSQDFSSASGGGGLALNIALSFCQIRFFKFRASLQIIGCHPDTPAHASEEMSSFAWTIVVYVGTSGYRAHTSSSSLVLKPRKLP